MGAMAEKTPNAALELPFGLPTPPAARIAPETAERPHGCHHDHDYREACPFISAGLAPECAPCPQWCPDWATFEAAMAAGKRKKASGLIPAGMRGKKAGKKPGVDKRLYGV